MIRRWWGLGVWIAAASILAAGRVGSSDDAATTTDVASTPIDPNGGVTALQRLRDLDAGGLSDVELALAELSAHLGPLPGAPVIGFDNSFHSSVTQPLNKALSLRDQMTDEQRTGLDSAVERPLHTLVRPGHHRRDLVVHSGHQAPVNPGTVNPPWQGCGQQPAPGCAATRRT